MSIADQTRDVLGDATVKLIPQLLEKTDGEIKADASKIGFVFPNYFGGMPNAVQRFVRRLNVGDVHYIFSFVPAGGGQGYSLKFLQRELRQKGKMLNYGRYVKGISNYRIAGYYMGMAMEKQENILRLLRDKIRLYTEEIKENRIFVERSSPAIFIVNRLLSSVSSRDVIKDTSCGDRKYSVGDKCTGCGICQKVCQANNIVMIGDAPSFLHQCYRCMACIQYCPQNAVLFNGKEMNKPQYTHPDFPAEKMIRRIRESFDDPLSAGGTVGSIESD